MRTKLPSVDRGVVRGMDEDVRDRQALSQLKSSERLNESRPANNDVAVGDQVLVKSAEQGKLSPTFSSSTVQVSAKEGSEVVIQDENGSLSRRNVSEVKPLNTNSDTPIRSCGPPTRYGEVVTH